ncbi:hypothetical protein J437_LFUL002220 [Ladona fulva]|uniref:Uncharacterized protein n=1 Tax=Ladona fulva TaxID=123851 RepID=A0A8K0JY36_LADFU|nr:hypothetical protein J437_LFUL002220 [Ladona fulva]
MCCCAQMMRWAPLPAVRLSAPSSTDPPAEEGPMAQRKNSPTPATEGPMNAGQRSLTSLSPSPKEVAAKEQRKGSSMQLKHDGVENYSK